MANVGLEVTLTEESSTGVRPYHFTFTRNPDSTAAVYSETDGSERIPTSTKCVLDMAMSYAEPCACHVSVLVPEFRPSKEDPLFSLRNPMAHTSEPSQEVQGHTKGHVSTPGVCASVLRRVSCVLGPTCIEHFLSNYDAHAVLQLVCDWRIMSRQIFC